MYFFFFFFADNIAATLNRTSPLFPGYKRGVKVNVKEGNTVPIKKKN